LRTAAVGDGDAAHHPKRSPRTSRRHDGDVHHRPNQYRNTSGYLISSKTGRYAEHRSEPDLLNILLGCSSSIAGRDSATPLPSLLYCYMDVRPRGSMPPSPSLLYCYMDVRPRGSMPPSPSLPSVLYLRRRCMSSTVRAVAFHLISHENTTKIMNRCTSSTRSV
jgi:hypothetical protein